MNRGFERDHRFNLHDREDIKYDRDRDIQMNDRYQGPRFRGSYRGRGNFMRGGNVRARSYSRSRTPSYERRQR